MSTKQEVESEGSKSDALLNSHIVVFVKELRTEGYAERTLKKKRSVSKAFAAWMRRNGISLHELSESHIAAFVSRLPRKRKARAKLERSVLGLLLQFLRRRAEVPKLLQSRDALPGEELLERYVTYLRKDRALAENSILVYAPFIRDFIRDELSTGSCPSINALDAATIQKFILGHIPDRSSEYKRLLATALRSFFRFLFVCGELSRDLSVAVPTVRKRQRPGVPAFLSPEEIKRVIAATDQSTTTGRRDRAILLLLARLGLRAGEVVTLELDDIHWRSGEILVRGKGGFNESLPLLADVGKALAQYLRVDHRTKSDRRVFHRVYAPPIGLAGPAAVGHIVRHALRQAGVQRRGRGAAHLFRHGLATQMIRKGASLAEISEVLRHHSLNTTAVYAQVSFEALRSVARPWPVLEGER